MEDTDEVSTMFMYGTHRRSEHSFYVWNTQTKWTECLCMEHTDEVNTKLMHETHKRSEHSVSMEHTAEVNAKCTCMERINEVNSVYEWNTQTIGLHYICMLCMEHIFEWYIVFMFGTR